jgi:uncharacterized protein YdaL
VWKAWTRIVCFSSSENGYPGFHVFPFSPASGLDRDSDDCGILLPLSFISVIRRSEIVLYLASWKETWRCTAVAAALLVFMGLILSDVQARTVPRVLVLYDVGIKGTETEWIGALHAQLMRNLLGHFDVVVTAKALATYQNGDLDRYDATFYLGTAWNNPLPVAFRQEALSSSKTLCWVNYNLWQIAWTEGTGKSTQNPAFVQHFGIRYLGMDSSGYLDIHYHGRQFKKRQDYRELGEVSIAEPTRASAIATARRKPNLAIPYITRAANLWYIADNPFEDLTNKDRYFVFADVLHDILKINHPERHRAIVRIEDVHPLTPPAKMREVADLCASLKVPFGVSVIPEYRDPLGADNNSAGKTVKMTEVPEFIDALRYMQKRGGQLILHGYTHQLDKTANPYNGVTADDAEFYRLTSPADEGTPVAGDSARWARDRVRAGLRLFHQSHLAPVGWNTPHYIASATDYRQFGRMFRVFVDHAQYYVTDSAGKTHSSDQMPPYILTDVYGCLHIPETLDYMRLSPTADEPTANTPADMADSAEAYLGVRDGWASFFYHLYLDPQYLREAILKIKALGYNFVPITPVLRP